MEVRDPIHGAIRLNAAETALVDEPFVQRLRHIKQTGFSHLPFPGATHSRYSHCLGTLHLAGLAFDSVFRDWSFASSQKRDAFRQIVRVAALCHDLGHAPFSHCTEFAMPQLSALGLEGYTAAERRASHEDYTIAILIKSGLAQTIEQSFPFTARHVAALVSDEVSCEEDFWLDGDRHYRRILAQLISSELDVDRLDYLPRDSYYTGARYGQVDVAWLLSNLEACEVDGAVSLALDRSAIYAFDDFMIARHHMFLMVYFHHRSVINEELLKRHVLEPGCPWRLPSELDAYLYMDDVWMEHELRGCSDEWARRVVEQRVYKRVVERHGAPHEIDLSTQVELLDDAGIDCIRSGSTGKLSRYNVFGQKRDRAPEIHVVDRLPGQAVQGVCTLAEATEVFHRYADARRIERLYVAPEQADRARQVLGIQS